MAPGSRTTRRSPYVSPLLGILGEQDDLVSTLGRSDAGNNEAPTFLEAPIPLLVFPPCRGLIYKIHEGFHGENIGPGANKALRVLTKG